MSDDYKDLEDGIHTELEQIGEGSQPTPKEDGLAALRQIPAPIFALDTLHSMISLMARSVVALEPNHNTELLNLVSFQTPSQGPRKFCALTIALFFINSLQALLLVWRIGTL